MLRLYGFSASNYYNAVKLALLEKELAFDEVLTYTGADERHQPEYLDKSPLGKVPCLETEEGFISESRCIIDYLEHAYPERPLFPAGAFAQAKIARAGAGHRSVPRARRAPALAQPVSRTEPPASIANDVRQTIAKATKALSRLARFDGYLVGDRFTAADISAAVHLPTVRRILGAVLKEDPLAEIPAWRST